MARVQRLHGKLPGMKKQGELKRLLAIIAKIDGWLDAPTLTPMQVVALTGLSRQRVYDLIEKGKFRRSSVTRSELELASVLAYYVKRSSALSKS